MYIDKFNSMIDYRQTHNFLFHFYLYSFRLQQVDENRKSVTNEIKKSICNLIMEINRKGKILVNQLEVCLLNRT